MSKQTLGHTWSKQTRNPSAQISNFFLVEAANLFDEEPLMSVSNYIINISLHSITTILLSPQTVHIPFFCISHFSGPSC